MREFKRVRAESVRRKPVRSQFIESDPQRPEPTMHTEAPVRKAGRLSREDQRRLGDILKRTYDDVIRQGVPDRFKALLNELDGSDEARPQVGHPTQEQTERSQNGDRLVEAKEPGHKGLDTSKGSH
jgi:Anti-sigma factor NepR